MSKLERLNFKFARTSFLFQKNKSKKQFGLPQKNLLQPLTQMTHLLLPIQNILDVRFGVVTKNSLKDLLKKDSLILLPQMNFSRYDKNKKWSASVTFHQT